MSIVMSIVTSDHVMASGPVEMLLFISAVDLGSSPTKNALLGNNIWKRCHEYFNVKYKH